MRWLQTLLHLRAPLAALALCALVAQQMVGFVLTASPALAIESGFSLCLSGPPAADDDPKHLVPAGFCPCTLTAGLALLPPSHPLVDASLLSSAALTVLPQARLLLDKGPTGPPPVRAPPFHLHS